MGFMTDLSFETKLRIDCNRSSIEVYRLLDGPVITNDASADRRL